ncbi:MAG: PQQ-binding-like beta-propeller repeat protein [Armatimonadota bacterium]
MLQYVFRVAAVLMMGLFASSSHVCADWPTFHGDMMRSGQAETPVAADVTIAWSTKLGSSVDSSPAVVGNRVYIGTADGDVVCVDASDGSELWRQQTGACVISSPAVSDGTVFVGSVDRCLYAFDAGDGDMRWRVRTWAPVVASPLVSGGRVYIGSMDGTFTCVQADSGDLLWQREGAAISAAAAAHADGEIFYGDEGGTLHACDGSTGEENWSQDFEGKIVAAPAVFGDRIIIGVMTPSRLKPPKVPFVICMDRQSGEIIWQKTDATSLMHTPVCDGELVYYAGVSGYTSSTHMFASRVSDGEEMWKKGLGGVADCSPAVAQDMFVFGNHDGKVHLWSIPEGREIGSIDMEAKLFSSPAVVESGVYFGTGDGRLVCLR